MKIEQTTLQKTFYVRHNGKIYYVDYLNSDGQILGLINRASWEISDEDGEFNIYTFQNSTKKEKEQTKKNLKIANSLIGFCIKHFDDYTPINEG